jgi:hypothetical protein
MGCKFVDDDRIGVCALVKRFADIRVIDLKRSLVSVAFPFGEAAIVDYKVVSACEELYGFIETKPMAMVAFVPFVQSQQHLATRFQSFVYAVRARHQRRASAG